MEKTILDYVRLIQKRLWIIVVFVLLSCATTYYVSQAFVKPVYTASGQLIVNYINTQGNNLNDVNVSLNLMESYKEIINSPKIMEATAKNNPQLGLTAGEIAGKLEVKTSEKSQVMNLQATDESYDKAAQIVNAVSSTFISNIPALMNLNNVKLLTPADPNLHPSPSNSGIMMNLMISFVLSLLVVIGAILFLESINNTLRTEKEAEFFIGVPVIASVPLVRKNKLGKETETLTGRVEEPVYASFK